MLGSRRFHVATEEEIRSGRVTDVYFVRAEEALSARDADRVVVGEARAGSLPNGWPWAVLCGVEELLNLAEAWNVRLWGLEEGAVFFPGEPVLTIEGRYTDFGRFETAFLGLLCQASGIATEAARCRVAAGDRTVLSFGARRMHPAIAPMIERACYLGGCDGVSTVAAADLLGIRPTGTMPHALILLIGDTVEAARAFDETAPEGVGRIVLIDTLNDERFEAVRVAEALGERLAGIRFDTPSSRRGDLAAIMRETRWELALRGYHDVRFFASGGLTPEEILTLNDVCDGYGVGTRVANAPTVNLSFDIVEIEGRPVSKRGKESGGKFVAACPECGAREVLYWRDQPGVCSCGGQRAFLNRLMIDGGRLVYDPPPLTEARARVLRALEGLTL